MIRIEEIERVATQASERHRQFLLALGGLAAEHMSGGKARTQAGRRAFLTQASRLAAAHDEEQARIIRDYAAQVRDAAFNDMAGVTGHVPQLDVFAPILEHVDGAIIDALAAHAAQVVRDVRGAEKGLRRFALSTQMLADQTGWALSASEIAVREQSQARGQSFFMDRAGRRWDASRYVYILVKSLMSEIYNEAALFMLSQAGRQTASVRHRDEGHRHHGIRFRISSALPGAGDLPGFEDLKREVFHPNASALVTA